MSCAGGRTKVPETGNQNGGEGWGAGQRLPGFESENQRSFPTTFLSAIFSPDCGVTSPYRQCNTVWCEYGGRCGRRRGPESPRWLLPCHRSPEFFAPDHSRSHSPRLVQKRHKSSRRRKQERPDRIHQHPRGDVPTPAAPFAISNDAVISPCLIRNMRPSATSGDTM